VTIPPTVGATSSSAVPGTHVANSSSQPHILLTSCIAVSTVVCWSSFDVVSFYVFFGARVGELLGEGGAFAEGGSLPVDDVDGEDEEEGDYGEDGGGVGEVVVAANVWRCDVSFGGLGWGWDEKGRRKS